MQNSLGVLPTYEIVAGFLESTFRRMRGAGDIVCSVLASDNLTTWTEIWTSDNSGAGSVDKVVLQRVIDIGPVTASARRFLRWW